MLTHLKEPQLRAIVRMQDDNPREWAELMTFIEQNETSFTRNAIATADPHKCGAAAALSSLKTALAKAREDFYAAKRNG